MDSLIVSTLLRRLLAAVLVWAALGNAVWADERKDPTGIVFPNVPNIVGGNTAADGEFPFLVRLYVTISGATYLCGGSLLSDTWVITAAHCLEGASASGISIRAGSNQKSSGGEVISATHLFVHPDYDNSTLDNDIALIELSAAVSAPNTGTISRLTTNEASAMPEGSTVWVAGWGTTSFQGSGTENLLKVSVDVSYRDTCATNSDYFDYELTNNMLCAGVPGGGQDACQGDSGGPLFRFSGNKTWLAGIVSWGQGCALADYPGVYTRVANYDNWITQTINADGSNTGGNSNPGGGPTPGADGTCTVDVASSRTGTQFRVNVLSGCSTDLAISYEAAANFWADFLASPVQIAVDANFEPLLCAPNSGVLGAAGPTLVSTDPRLPDPDTSYTIAHANSLVGEDLAQSSVDVEMTFNSGVGQPGCLENKQWYFDDGSSPTTPANTIDFYGTILHEIAHGLGFLSLMYPSYPEEPEGNPDPPYAEWMNDVYSQKLDNLNVSPLSGLTPEQRFDALTDPYNLVWTGSGVGGLADTLNAGTSAGSVRMYAPDPYQGGSSVSHFDTSLDPNDLMEPFKTARNATDYRMTKNLFRDIGWKTIPDAPGITSVSAGINYVDVSLQAPYHLGNTLLLNYTATCGGQSATAVGPTLRVSGLSPETGYTCSATVTTAVGESDPSASLSVSTLSSLPGQATITSIDTLADEVTFLISLSSGSTILIEQYVVDCTSPDGIVISSNSATTSVTVAGLDEGVDYSCAAFAESSGGAGPTSSATTVSVDGVLPGLPVWLLYQATQSR